MRSKDKSSRGAEGLRILHKTSDGEGSARRRKKSLARVPSISFNELVEATYQAASQEKAGWKTLAVEKTVSASGHVRRKAVNYTRDTKSRLLPKLTGRDGPLFILNRALGLSEINQGLLKINSGDLGFEGIPCTVHLPQVNQTIETLIKPEYRFTKGFRNSPHLAAAVSGKKRMMMTELGSDDDKPQLQITFY
jgi:hypothetical protein